MAGVLLYAMTIKEAHHLLSHDHHDHPVCEADQLGQQHFHSEEYGFDNCQICSLPFLQLPTGDLLADKMPVLSITSKGKFFLIDVDGSTQGYSYLLRGPPFA